MASTLVNSVKILKRMEDFLEQCNKIEKSEIIKKCIQLLSLVNEDSHEKVIEFYRAKITSYWETIKQDINKNPLELSNSTFVIEHPLKVDFDKILKAATPEQKIILTFHFKSVAARIWPEEFPETPGREAAQIDALFESLIAFGNSQGPSANSESVIKNLKEYSPLINQSKAICSAMTSGDLDIFKSLEHCLKRLEETKSTSDQSIEELKSLVKDMKENPLDMMMMVNVVTRLKQLEELKHLKVNKSVIFQSLPEEAKKSSTTKDVLNLFFPEEQEEEVVE